MSHYNIYVEMKDGKPVPKEWIPAIRKIMACFGCDETKLSRNGFVLESWGGWYDYDGDFEEASLDGFITRDIRGFYDFAKHNMEIYSDCWNPTDTEHGPNGWDEFEKFTLNMPSQAEDALWQIILKKEKERREIFHVHTWRCGHAGNFSDREYVEKALELGANKITFTDHAPFPGNPFRNRMRMDQLPEYIESMKRLKEEYGDRIDVVCGLEIEYLPSFLNYYEKLKKMDGMEYMLLGQHFYEVSGGVYGFILPPAEKNETEASGCGRATVEAIKSGLFDGVAHPDRIFRRRKEWDKEMDQIADDIVTAAWRSSIPLEINERSLGHEHQFWPEFWSWTTVGQVPVLHGVDAHSPDELKLL